jgi:phosphonate metabolism protein PhnN/1,5-bisphosphokinase (PRPP-forming)
VVGPSGAGKDAILEGARRRLADDPGFVFVRREITRPADAGGEDHAPVSMAEFRKRAVNGAYALAWEAHGHGYGVPATALAGLVHGQSAIVNVSRGILASARSRFEPVRIVNVSVPRHILEERLARRGREDNLDIAQRLARADAFQVDGSDVFSLVNDGPLDRSLDAFVEILRSASPRNG